LPIEGYGGEGFVAAECGAREFRALRPLNKDGEMSAEEFVAFLISGSQSRLIEYLISIPYAAFPDQREPCASGFFVVVRDHHAARYPYRAAARCRQPVAGGIVAPIDLKTGRPRKRPTAGRRATSIGNTPIMARSKGRPAPLRATAPNNA
jgi:hypothetical protein